MKVNRVGAPKLDVHRSRNIAGGAAAAIRREAGDRAGWLEAINEDRIGMGTYPLRQLPGGRRARLRCEAREQQSTRRKDWEK